MCYLDMASLNVYMLSERMEYWLLGGTNEESMKNYRELFHHQIDHDVLHEIRESLNTVSELGNDYLREQIEAILERSVRPARVGRPRKYEVNEPFITYYVLRKSTLGNCSCVV